MNGKSGDCNPCDRCSLHMYQKYIQQPTGNEEKSARSARSNDSYHRFTGRRKHLQNAYEQVKDHINNDTVPMHIITTSFNPRAGEFVHTRT